LKFEKLKLHGNIQSVFLDQNTKSTH